MSNENQDIKLPFLSRPEEASEPTTLPTAVPVRNESEKALESPTTNEVSPPSPASNETYVFSCFPDGSLFRYGAHPDGSVRQCLLDSRGTVVGVVACKAVADFLVRGAHCLCCVLRDEARGVEKESAIVDSHGETMRPKSSNIPLN